VNAFRILQPADYPRVAPLLATLAELHGSIPAVLAGTAEGRVRVDDLAAPRVVLLDGPEGLYLGGAPTAALDRAALRAAIDPLAYLYPDAAWLPVIEAVLPHPFMLRHERLALSLDLGTASPPPAPPADRFVARPMADGVGAELLDGELVVAHCHEDMVVGDRIEVGVWTDPRYRRQGLARRAVAGAIAVARQRGLRRMGWHCLTSNAGSLQVALRSGFSIVDSYVAYGARLGAENRDDLDASTWLSLATQFEAGAEQLPLLRLFSAEALSNAARPEAALDALERLVETNWHGKAAWLEHSWALAPLRADPAFARLVSRQRQAEGALDSTLEH